MTNDMAPIGKFDEAESRMRCRTAREEVSVDFQVNYAIIPGKMTGIQNVIG